MKKLIAMLIGMGLATGAVSFAKPDEKPADGQKTEAKKKRKKNPKKKKTTEEVKKPAA
jgi:hypothetical protein